MSDLEKLTSLVLAPYIIKATALIGVQRKIGGNQFRHSFATLGILLDYKLFSDHVLLKASVIHDLIEDVPSTDIYGLRCIDHDSWKVVELVLEVTRKPDEEKTHYLKRVLENGSGNALLLKAADRISNLTDLHLGFFSDQKMSNYLDETEQYILPMALRVNQDMVIELRDLIDIRRRLITKNSKTSDLNFPKNEK
jgi:(p)ppGpp synthase/HD superfamily hydrolase